MRNAQRVIGLVAITGLMGTVALAGCDKLPSLGKSSGDDKQATASLQPPGGRISDPGVLALINGSPVTIETFRRRVEVLPEDDPRGFMTEFGPARLIHRQPRTVEERGTMLDELIKEELLVQEAVALGVGRQPEVERRLEEARRLVLLDALTRRDVELMAVTDAEVEEYYTQVQEGLKEPERLRVRQIVIGTLPEAEAIRATAVGGADFAQLARDRSTGAGKEQGGEVGWYVRASDKELAALVQGKVLEEKTFFEQMEPVAFALDLNQISQPVKGPDGFYLVKLEERKPATARALSEVWDQIHDGLLFQKQQQHFQERMDRLLSQATVERNEQHLDQL